MCIFAFLLNKLYDNIFYNIKIDLLNFLLRIDLNFTLKLAACKNMGIDKEFRYIDKMNNPMFYKCLALVMTTDHSFIEIKRRTFAEGVRAQSTNAQTYKNTYTTLNQEKYIKQMHIYFVYSVLLDTRERRMLIRFSDKVNGRHAN